MSLKKPEVVQDKYTDRVIIVSPFSTETLDDDTLFKMNCEYEVHVRGKTLPNIKFSKTGNIFSLTLGKVVLKYPTTKEFVDFIQLYASKTLKDYVDDELHFSKTSMIYPLLIRSIQDITNNLSIQVTFGTSDNSYSIMIPVNKLVFDISTKIIQYDNMRFWQIIYIHKFKESADVFYTVLRTIEEWCKDEAYEWGFPAFIKFEYKWRLSAAKYVEVVCKKEVDNVYYFVTSESKPVYFVDMDMDNISYDSENDGQSIYGDIKRYISANIDTKIWNRTDDVTKYKQSVIKALNRADITRSIDHVCDTETIRQRFNECWYIAAVVLASKVLYDKLQPKTQGFLKLYRQQKQPISKKGMALFLPSCISILYRSYIRDNTSDFSLMQRFVHDGGSNDILLQAILQSNQISYKLHRHEYMDGFPTFITRPIAFSLSRHTAEYLLLVEEDGQRKSSSPNKWDTYIRSVISAYNDCNCTVVGGMISYETPNVRDSLHAIPFTVCGHNTIICNYGKCYEYMREISTVEVLVDIVFLIELKTQKSSFQKIKEDHIAMNNFKDLKLTLDSHDLILTITVSHVEENPNIIHGRVKTIEYIHSVPRVLDIKIGDNVKFDSSHRLYKLILGGKLSALQFFPNQSFNFTKRILYAHTQDQIHHILQKPKSHTDVMTVNQKLNALPNGHYYLLVTNKFDALPVMIHIDHEDEFKYRVGNMHENKWKMDGIFEEVHEIIEWLGIQNASIAIWKSSAWIVDGTPTTSLDDQYGFA